MHDLQKSQSRHRIASPLYLLIIINPTLEAQCGRAEEKLSYSQQLGNVVILPDCSLGLVIARLI